MTKVFEIHRLENGWFTVKTDTDIEGNPYNRATGYSLVEPNREGECLLLRELLYEIIEELLPHSKHEKYNLVVEIEERGE